MAPCLRPRKGLPSFPAGFKVTCIRGGGGLSGGGGRGADKCKGVRPQQIVVQSPKSDLIDGAAPATPEKLVSEPPALERNDS